MIVKQNNEYSSLVVQAKDTWALARVEPGDILVTKGDKKQRKGRKKDSYTICIYKVG